MIIYLTKSAACITLFYAGYTFLLRQTTRFQLNRVYLLTGILLSFIIPLVIVDVSSMNTNPAIIKSGGMMDNPGVDQITSHVTNNYTFIEGLYYFGFAVSLLITLISILKPVRLYLKAHKVVRNHRFMIIHPGIKPFSFFGVLFLPSYEEDPIIIEHEMVHINQRHWIDLLLVEVAAILLWFNPVMHWYRRSVVIQHEYIADREVTLNVAIETYLDCIAKQIESNIYSKLVSSFNTQSIKQRIIMITNTKKFSMARYAIIFPVVALLIMAFATRKAAPVVATQNKEFRSPVDVSRLKPGKGSGFGKRLNPETNRMVFHTGLDFVLDAGNSVYAAADGVVVSATNSGSYGNHIVIEHSKGVRTSSAHLESMRVKNGDKVVAGQVIGTVGSTGLSKAPHLHFEVLRNGEAVDPVPYLNVRIE